MIVSSLASLLGPHPSCRIYSILDGALARRIHRNGDSIVIDGFSTVATVPYSCPIGFVAFPDGSGVFALPRALARLEGDEPAPGNSLLLCAAGDKVVWPDGTFDFAHPKPEDSPPKPDLPPADPHAGPQ